MSEVLWLNKETLEERWLRPYICLIYPNVWVQVPKGATFATGDKDNFVFRKDGWCYDNRTSEWIKSDVTIQNLYTYEIVKLFWVAGSKDNVFTLKRLLGCEVLFGNRKLFIEDIVNIYSVEVGNKNYQDCARVSDLIFFTEDGDGLTFDEYVERYYGDGV